MPTAPTPDHLYSSFGIEPEWDDPSRYTEKEAADENGRYPPDWDRRRKAVLHHYSYKCARCGRRDGNVNHGSLHVHHYVPLSNGGTNELSNLLPLCGDCHSLMHPGNGLVDGDYNDAPIFPYENADLRVAVVRNPKPWDDLVDDHRELLHELEGCSLPVGKTTYARSGLTYHLNPDDAIIARDPARLRKRIEEHTGADPFGELESTSSSSTSAAGTMSLSNSSPGKSEANTGLTWLGRTDIEPGEATEEDFHNAPLWVKVLVLMVVPLVWAWDLLRYTWMYGPYVVAGGCVVGGGYLLVAGLFTYTVLYPPASTEDVVASVTVLVFGAVLVLVGYKGLTRLRAH